MTENTKYKINSPHKALFAALKREGAIFSVLDQTNVIVAERKGRRLFFIDQYTPLVPHNIGLILTNEILVENLLRHNNIPVNFCRSDEQVRYRVYFDKNGYLNILKQKPSKKDEIGFIDVTVKNDKVLRGLAEEVLKCFPPLAVISFDVSVQNIEGKDVYIINSIWEHCVPHYSFFAQKNYKKIKTVNLVAKYILKMLK